MDLNKINLVMADKDLNERDRIKELLPWVKVLICLFHALKTFRREITLEAMKITSQMKENCLELIQKLAYAKNEDEYDGLYTQFHSIPPESVKNYFDENWHPIREEWVAGFKQVSGNFQNATNKRLESINAKGNFDFPKFPGVSFYGKPGNPNLKVVLQQKLLSVLYIAAAWGGATK